MADALSSLITKLQLGDDEAVADELGALLAIYGDDALETYTPSRPPSLVESGSEPHPPNRYLSVRTSLPPPHDDIPLRFLVTLHCDYPSTPPQLQVQTIYIGDHASDFLLFGDILRVYMSEGSFSPGDAALFDGIERAREVALTWYLAKEEAKPAAPPPLTSTKDSIEVEVPRDETAGESPKVLQSPRAPSPPPSLPKGMEIATSEPIQDRKSVFVGWAARISSPDQVDVVLSYLKSDRKVARATHNIYAWRCRTGDGILHQDNDDDGESAAGARLSHLLHILDVENALVVCSRWYGGIHLGNDRFKHINAAARSALEAADLIPLSHTKSKAKKH